jgi:ParB-like chromosome segregation protein Spo0J
MTEASPHPIDNIQWIDTDLLDANDYNPNVVIGPEWKLLKLSMLKQGWLQPVLVSVIVGEDGQPTGRYRIIDGFHRSTMAKTDKEVRARFGTAVPCAVLDISEAERKMLTVRINRAKGSHMAARMHDLVTSLVNEHGIPVPQLCDELGASRAEIDLLLQENVFTKLEITDHVYSRAWAPKDKTGK